MSGATPPYPGYVRAVVPYAALVRQFHGAPPGKIYLLHGQGLVFRLSLSAAAQALQNGVPLTLVDGSNRFDAYYLAEFARSATARGDGPSVTPEEMLERIYVSRAFTCYQMEALITDRLPQFLERSRSPVVIIFGLLDTFYDDQAPLFEVRQSLQRIIAALRRLREKGIAVLLASLDLRPATREELFPTLAGVADSVFSVSAGESGLRITREVRPPGYAHCAQDRNEKKRSPLGGTAMGRTLPTFTMVIQQEMAELGKIPARAAPGGSGGAR